MPVPSFGLSRLEKSIITILVLLIVSVGLYYIFVDLNERGESTKNILNSIGEKTKNSPFSDKSNQREKIELAEHLRFDALDIVELEILSEHEVEKDRSLSPEDLRNFAVLNRDAVEIINDLREDYTELVTDSFMKIKVIRYKMVNGDEDIVTKIERVVRVKGSKDPYNTVTIVEVIPKNVALNTILLRGDFEVILDDPLIAFEFEEVEDQEYEYSYSVIGNSSDNADQSSSLSYGSYLDKNGNLTEPKEGIDPIFYILGLAIVVILIIFFVSRSKKVV